MRPEIARRVADAGLADRVTLVGRVSEATLHAWYEAATLFVHPTLYEGSSLVTLEAMTHRRPVVATRTGGLPDKVRPGETGWLVPPGDAGALADALGATLDSGAKLTTIGLAGRALVDAEFSWAQATGRMMAVFGELVTRARML